MRLRGIMSERLNQKIRSRIEASEGCVIPFDEYMQMALYDIDEGYYSTRVPIGKRGDFVTAPEVSPLFARCIGVQYQEFASDRLPSIFEFGAGMGTLAFNLLEHLDECNRLPEHYFILDISAHLRKLQRELLETLAPHIFKKIVWLDALPAVPVNAFVIANEVLDAMPVKKVAYAEGRWDEIGVTFEAERFAFKKLSEPSAGIEAELGGLTSLLGDVHAYETELNMNISAWLKSVSDMLTTGLLLVVDYGFPRHEYYLPQRSMGTIMCHSRQKSHPDPLFAPGCDDITAHVDFTAVAEAGIDAGFEVDGYTNQAHFLLSLGILDQAESFEDRQAVKILTMPHEMGELFKVMVLSKNCSKIWRGFSLDDRRGRL